MEVIQSGRRLLGTYFRVAFYGQVRSSWLLYLQFSCREDTFTCTARCCTQNGLWKLECKSNGCGESDSLTTRRLCDSSMITWINLNCAATWYNTTIFNKGMVATLLRFIAHVCPQMTVSTSLNDHRSHSVKHHLYLTPLYWSVCHDCGKRVFTYWIAVFLLRAMVVEQKQWFLHFAVRRSELRNVTSALTSLLKSHLNYQQTDIAVRNLVVDIVQSVSSPRDKDWTTSNAAVWSSVPGPSGFIVLHFITNMLYSRCCEVFKKQEVHTPFKLKVKLLADKIQPS